MPYTPDRLFGGSLTTTLTTILLTAAAGEKIIVRHILLSNTTAADKFVTLSLAGVNVVNNIVVPAATPVELPIMQIVRAGETVTGGVTILGVDCLISGVRIT